MPQRLMQDARTDLNAALFSTMLDVVSRGGRILEKKDPFSYSADIIRVQPDVIFSLKNPEWKSFLVSSEEELSEGNLDSSSFEVGTDYYVYLVDDGAGGLLIISANATFPEGHTPDDSRKIGGFHYGHIRKVSTDGLWIPVDSEGTKFGSGAISWKDNVTVGIVPNSVWDLVHRPVASPEGMVQVGSLWVDIYLAGLAEAATFENDSGGLHIASGRLQSRYGRYPATGVEDLHWYNFTELATRIGKRLLTYGEWIKAAFGNPQGEDSADNYGWTKTTNSARTRTGCRVDPATGEYNATTGIKPAAISAYNIVDAVGNVREWLDELLQRDGTDFQWHDPLGAGKGQVYSGKSISPVAVTAGEYWNGGVHAGPWTASVDAPPGIRVTTTRGVRLACDSLKRRKRWYKN